MKLSKSSTILKESTLSICPNCLKRIKASVIEENNQIFMLKLCPIHGNFKVLIEKDAFLYKKLMNKQFEKNISRYYNKLEMPISFSCNLDCPICYFPYRNSPDLLLDRLKENITKFNGTYITLNGGEPTLRPELTELIRFIIKNKKIPILVTNGLKLSGMGYIKKLEAAGLRFICFSFNGFDDEAYKKINGRKILFEKLKALKNISKTKIMASISMLVEKGVNEGEIKKIIEYCLKNDSFVYEFRLRSSNTFGKYVNDSPYYLSELLDLVCKAVNLEKKKFKSSLENTFLKSHSICRLSMDIYSYKKDASYILVGLDMGVKTKKGQNEILPLRLIRKNLYILDFVKKIKLDKAYAFYKLSKLMPLKRFAIFLFKLLVTNGRLVKMRIEIRKWPNKDSIDFMEINQCPTLYLTKNNKKVPFCQGLTLNKN